jgi:hypothetical protein
MTFFEFAIDESSHLDKLIVKARLKKRPLLTHPWRRQNGEEEKSS